MIFRFQKTQWKHINLDSDHKFLYVGIHDSQWIGSSFVEALIGSYFHKNMAGLFF